MLKHKSKQIEQLMNNLDLIDIWRELNPELKDTLGEEIDLHNRVDLTIS